MDERLIGIDALLERLVAQFASPYDFLRELVQNAQDAGSERVEVWLDVHAGDGGDEVVFELTVADTGEGMDEAIIDDELTRLFASSKTGDRTKIGGFGIGFVSVFAWEPEVVILQTGRAGEAWELVFHPDRRFEKHPLAEPVESTTLHLFKRGLAAEREAIANAVRDSLWRWCRFSGLEITFEDLASGEPPELIQDSPLPPGEDLVCVQERGDTHVQVAFAVPASVVLLRRGLVLAEGTPDQLLLGIAKRLGSSVRHIRVWADSPLLRTTLARDKVVEDAGRVAVEQQVVEVLDQLRGDLLDRLETLVLGAGAWDRARHARYGMLHAHLALEREHTGARSLSRRILRGHGSGRPWSASELAPARGAALVVAADPHREPNPDDDELYALARLAGIPVLVARLPDDGEWLRPLCQVAGLELREVRDALTRVLPADDDAVAMCELIERILAKVVPGVDVRIGQLTDVPRESMTLLAATLVERGEQCLALHGEDLRPALAQSRTIWIHRDHPLVQAAARTYPAAPLTAAAMTAFAIATRLGHQDTSELVDAIDELHTP